MLSPRQSHENGPTQQNVYRQGALQTKFKKKILNGNGKWGKIWVLGRIKTKVEAKRRSRLGGDKRFTLSNAEVHKIKRLSTKGARH